MDVLAHVRQAVQDVLRVQEAVAAVVVRAVQVAPDAAVAVVVGVQAVQAVPVLANRVIRWQFL